MTGPRATDKLSAAVRGVAVCCLLSAAATSIAQPDFRALSTIKKAMERDLRTNYSAVRVIHGWGAKEPMRVRRDQSDAGYNSVLVLSPLSRQGETSVDNGKNWVQFFPDRRTLIIQDSPIKRGVVGDPAVRYELLKRNYTVRGEGSDTVAGRKAMIVRISPERGAPLFTRRFWVDDEKSVLLRVEWQELDGRRQIVSDTLSIDFPSSMPEETFRIKIAGEPRQLHVQAPIRMATVEELERRVGFGIRQPIRMPFGFLLTGADAIIANNRAMAALRYTDGATNLTIYQARANAENPPWRANSSRGDFELEGLLLAVEGDITSAGRERVIAALRESTAAREAALSARAAEMFSVPESVVTSLRSRGLGFDEAVTSLILAGRDDERRSKCVGYLTRGRCAMEISKYFGKKDSDVRSGLARFWEAR